MIGFFIIIGFMFFMFSMMIASLIQAAFGEDCWQKLSEWHPIRWIAEDIEEYKRKKRLRKFQRKKK